MTDPKRWTESGSDATAFERELLTAGRCVAPSPEVKEAAWAGVLLGAALSPASAHAASESTMAHSGGAQPPAQPAAPGASTGGPLTTVPPPAGLATGATTSATTLTWGATVKGVAWAVALLGAVGGGYWALQGGDASSGSLSTSLPASPSEGEDEALPTIASPHEVRPSAEEATAPSEARDGEDVDAESDSAGERVQSGATQAETPKPATRVADPAIPVAAPGEGEKRAEPEAMPASRLREESLAVLRIRGALRGGDPGGALRLLEAARRDFPGGALGQEREALTIEALARSGAKEAAGRRARAFLKAYPKSPYAADVRSFAAP